MDDSERIKIVTRPPQFSPKLKYSRLFGQYRNPKYLSKAEWTFLSVSSLSLLVSMGFTMHRLVTLPKNSDDYTFIIMLGFTTLVSFYYIISGVMKERWPELLVFIVSCFILTGYLAVNVAYASPIPGNTEKTMRLSFGVVFLVWNSGLGVRLVYVYATRFRMVCLINCREDMVKRLKWLFCCASLITLDWQLQATMLICALENGTAATWLEIGLIAGGALVASIRIAAGYISIYEESKLGMSAFFFLWLPNLGYMVYKCKRLVYLAPYEHWTTLYHASIACVVATLILWVVLLPAMVKLAMNFGKGIKEALRYDATVDQPHVITEHEDRHGTDAAGEVAEEDRNLHRLNRLRFNV